MKLFLLIGGTLGFASAFGAAFSSGHEPGMLLRDGAVGCVAGALLMRIFYAVLMSCVRDLAAAKMREAAAGAPGENAEIATAQEARK